MTRATPSPSSAGPAPAPRPAQPAARPRPGGPAIDPIRVLRQNLGRIMLVLVLGAVLGVGLNFLFASAYPLWSSKVMLEIKSQLEAANDLNAKEFGTEDTVVRVAQTEVARLMSKDNLKAALQRPEILKTQWSEGYRDAKGIFVVEDALMDIETELRSGHQRGTQIFYVSWSAHSPEDAPTVLNAVADTYILSRRNAEDSRFATTLKVYEVKRDELDKRILQVKQQIQDFIKANRLTSLNEANSENQRTLEKLRADIAQTTADLSVAQSRRAQVEKKLSNETGYSDDDKRRAQDDPIVLQLQRDVEDLMRRLKSLKTQLLDEKHPDRFQAQANFDSAEQQLKAKLDEVLARNSKADLKDAINKEESLGALLKQQNEDFAKESKKVEDFTANMAEMNNYKDQLDILQERRKEVGKTIQDINLALSREERNRVEIVQRALKPREITFPQFKYMIPGTAVLLTGLFVLLLFVRELLDQRVKYPSDLGAVPGKMLGAVPEISDDPSKPARAERVVMDAPGCFTAESYRQLAAQVYKGMQAMGARTLMVVSPMPESGTTTVASNIALCEAAVGRNVLVIGANMRRPGLARIFGLPMGTPGLGEVLAGQDPSSAITQVAPNLSLMTAGAPGSRVFDRINTNRTDEVLAWARDRFDLVIIDSPPSIVAGEALSLANKVDAAMVVARAWQDQRGLVMKLASQLMDSRCQLLGVMLNRMHMTPGGYLRKNAEAMAEYAQRTAVFGGTDEAPVTKGRRGRRGRKAPEGA